MGIVNTIRNSKKIMNQVARESESLIYLDDEARRTYQLFLLEIYKDIADVCKKYDLKIFVIGGTALGAVRHKGFIPWDDDLDTGMFREDYEVFKSIFHNELSDKYILNAPNYATNPIRGYTRILKKGTYYKDIIDNNDTDVHHIFIDIFVLDNVPENSIIRAVKGKWCDFAFRVARCVYIWENRTEEVKEFYMLGGKTNYYVRAITGILFSFCNSSKWYNLADHSAMWSKESDYCGIPTGRKRYLGEIMQKKEILPGIEFDFEDEKVLVFSNYDPYLKNLYGEYMKIPPENERERHPFCNIKYNEE